MSLGLRHRERAADQVPTGPSPPADPAKGETAIWRRGPLAGRGPSKRTRILALSGLAVLAVAIAFEVVYGQRSLYHGNQYTYLLHGLAEAGVGLLEADWQAQTTDPAPVSSLLVAAAAGLGAEWLILGFHALLIGVYGLSLLGIGITVCRIRSLASRLVLLAALLFFHSWVANEIQGPLPDDIRSLVTKGLAGQYAPGLTYQPSLFGVLLIASLFAYARGRLFAAIAIAATAAIFHPTYLLGAVVLCGAYLADRFVGSAARASVARGAALAVAMLVPVALYALLAFGPAAPSVHEAAQSVLVDFRIPRHANPRDWFAPDDAVRLGIVAAGLLLSWRSVLFPVLALTVSAGAVLTALQLITNSDTLALLFPWRLSVFLVPVCAAIVLAAGTRALFALARAGGRVASRFVEGPPSRVARVGRTAACVLAGLVIAMSLVVGAQRIGRLDSEPKASPIGRLASGERRPGELYLIPPQAYEFRIDAAVPVYIDYKTHPYADLEVLEWRRRLREATRVYAGGTLHCDRLRSLARRERITHVVVRSPTRTRCRFLDKRYSADGYTVLAVRPARRNRA